VINKNVVGIPICISFPGVCCYIHATCSDMRNQWYEKDDKYRYLSFTRWQTLDEMYFVGGLLEREVCVRYTLSGYKNPQSFYCVGIH